jgi:hypothetical protein
MASQTEYQEPELPDKECFEPLPYRFLLWCALWPYFFILLVARLVPSFLGRMSKPTKPPSLRVLLLCAPLTVLQLVFAVVFLPVLWFDYDRYLRDIGEKGKKLESNPEEGISHNMVTWLYTRHLEHPWFKPDLLAPDTELRQAAKNLDAPHYILRALPPRGPRPQMMEGLPQRQLTQLPSSDETKLLESMVFDGLFKAMGKKVEVGPSPMEGTGALGVRWENPRCCPDLKMNKQEFVHQHSFDKSWHMLLAPADAYEVLEKGWGERGPPHVVWGLAPVGMCLVYAPRNAEERLVFLDILAASCRYCEDETYWEGGRDWKGKSKAQ